VGMLAGHGQAGPGMAVIAGLLTLWVTFIPCFLWIFAAAPYVEWLLARPRLRGGLAAISAAVVGVILNLSLWFALHVLFGRVADTPFGPWPDLASFDAQALLLVLLSMALVFGARVPLVAALFVSGLIALGLSTV